MSFKGTLSELALADLVEITSLGAKTGVLEITYPDGEPAGRLAFLAARLTGRRLILINGRPPDEAPSRLPRPRQAPLPSVLRGSF